MIFDTDYDIDTIELSYMMESILSILDKKGYEYRIKDYDEGHINKSGDFDILHSMFEYEFMNPYIHFDRSVKYSDLNIDNLPPSWDVYYFNKSDNRYKNI